MCDMCGVSVCHICVNICLGVCSEGYMVCSISGTWGPWDIEDQTGFLHIQSS